MTCLKADSYHYPNYRGYAQYSYFTFFAHIRLQEAAERLTIFQVERNTAVRQALNLFKNVEPLPLRRAITPNVNAL